MSNDLDRSEIQVDLPADLTAPREARAAAKHALPGWRLTALLDPLLLVISELVGNAVRHGKPPVDMRLRKSGRGVHVAVHDDGPSAPARAEAASDAESGRGLLLVDALAAESGVQQVEGDGKIVWARVDAEESGAT